MKGKAFAPGHISGFFEPVYSGQDVDRSGSRGSGMSISFGATTEIMTNSAVKQQVDVLINNKRTPAPVTELALRYLVGDNPIQVRVNTLLDLPLGQGFGMSGAGALSATYALAHILNIPREQALKASHYAEVQLRTGLGDVLASSFGGIEIRREAGLPPWGMIEHIPGSYEIVLCIIGEQVATRDILTDATRIQGITHYGRYCLKKILEKPSVENLFSLSQTFTEKTGLAHTRVLEAMNASQQYGMASMCMLGNSIFSIGNTNELCKVLAPYGKVFICSVDQCGARVIEGEK